MKQMMHIVAVLVIVSGSGALAAPGPIPSSKKCEPTLMGHAALVAKHLTLQAGLNKSRPLATYEKMIFQSGPPLQSEGKTVKTGVKGFVETLTGQDDPRLVQLFEFMAKRNQRPVVWYDMGGGFAIPARHLKRARRSLAAIVTPVVVDLIDWEKETGPPTEMAKFRAGLANGANIFNSDYRPEYIFGDMTEAPIAPADVITSVESFMYAEDKLKALVHWYNSLADDGLLFIASDYNWHDWIKIQPNNKWSAPAPIFYQLISVLRRASVPYAYSSWNRFTDRLMLDGVTALVIQKVPGTKLEMGVNFIGAVEVTSPLISGSLYQTLDGLPNGSPLPQKTDDLIRVVRDQ